MLVIIIIMANTVPENTAQSTTAHWIHLLHPLGLDHEAESRDYKYSLSYFQPMIQEDHYSTGEWLSEWIIPTQLIL